MLAKQIINRAKLDLKRIEPEKDKTCECQRIQDREDAKMFIYSEWFRELCEFSRKNSIAIVRKYRKYIDFDDIIVENMECVNER